MYFRSRFNLISYIFSLSNVQTSQKVHWRWTICFAIAAGWIWIRRIVIKSMMTFNKHRHLQICSWTRTKPLVTSIFYVSSVRSELWIKNWDGHHAILFNRNINKKNQSQRKEKTCFCSRNKSIFGSDFWYLTAIISCSSGHCMKNGWVGNSKEI